MTIYSKLVPSTQTTIYQPTANNRYQTHIRPCTYNLIVGYLSRTELSQLHK